MYQHVNKPARAKLARLIMHQLTFKKEKPYYKVLPNIGVKSL